MAFDEIRLTKGNVPRIPFSASTGARTTDFGDPGKLSDSLLWNEFKKGDELAFISIYNNYFRMLYDYGCKYASDKELVRDCLQDFFLYLRKNRLGFGDTNSIKFYLLKSFRRRVIEYLKKNRHQFNVKEPDEYALFGVESSIEAVYINKQVKAEQLEKLNKALMTLDRIEQDAIYYFYFKGLSYEQIAEIFNFSHVSSARRVMYRSLRQLRRFFN
ncbi:sigma-70 family RNA polymerase sigma factor [Chitinophaga sp. MM2321]|uniref:RNA polymerase sigma factor n=1 Tax=Chitinophaga sp. MM2321 TaxID=3137178 RepID=UPI0032D5AABD